MAAGDMRFVAEALEVETLADGTVEVRAIPHPDPNFLSGCLVGIGSPFGAACIIHGCTRGCKPTSQTVGKVTQHFCTCE